MLLDDHELTARARAYAHEVVQGDEWPITDADVDLSAVEWRTSTRMESRHGHAGWGRRAEVCEYYVHLSEKSYRLGGWEKVAETVRHELVHVWQYQNDRPSGHGPSFRRWVDPLELEGRRSTYARDEPFAYWRYPFYCPACEAVVGGRHRYCRAVEQCVTRVGGRICARTVDEDTCGTELYLARDGGGGAPELLVPRRSNERDDVYRFVDGASGLPVSTPGDLPDDG